MIILQAILLAVSLCADCFAVTTCSSITLKSVTVRRVLVIAIVFATVQTLLMLVGWLFGDLFVGFVSKAARWIGFLLLLYVGGSMILEGIKGDEEVRDLNGLRNLILGAVATSIDALAVGISMSLTRIGEDALASDHALMVNTMIADHVAVFVVTMLSVFAGMYGGYRAGRRFGRPAEIVGGLVLICIGLGVLFGII
jgi:putative Mn2+ efflux pump MntP